MAQKSLMLILVAFVWGCAPYEPPEPSLDHPAHPDAREAVTRPLPSTLEIRHESLPSRPPELQEKGMDSMDDHSRSGRRDEQIHPGAKEGPANG